MKRKKIIGIFCNGEKINKKIFSLFSNEINFIICADGGSNKIYHLNIEPDIIIGDMDSISNKSLKKFKKSKIISINNQNSTDLEKALKFTVKMKPDKIYIFGAMGNRIDHTLTNLNLIKKYYKYSDIQFITNKSKLIYSDKPVKLHEKIGTTISLIPIGKVTNVHLTGFLYPLNYENLEFGGRDGQSNRSIAYEQIIDFKKGELFIVINF
jgi:thiamine pyrophosphokinase